MRKLMLFILLALLLAGCAAGAGDYGACDLTVYTSGRVVADCPPGVIPVAVVDDSGTTPTTEPTQPSATATGDPTATQAPSATPLPTIEPTIAPTATAIPTATAVPTATPPGGTIWGAIRQSDAETGTINEIVGGSSPETGWSLGGLWNSGTGRGTVTSAYAHSGNYSYALTTGPTAGGARLAWRGTVEDPRLPTLSRYSAWYFFPTPVDPRGYMNIMQWKSAYDRVSGGSSSEPTASVNLDMDNQGRMYLLLNHKIGPNGEGGASNKHNVAQAPAGVYVPVGQWFNITCEYKWAQGTGGYIDCWQDGAHLWRYENAWTEFPWTGFPGYNDLAHSRQIAVNNYNDGLAPSTYTLYIDDIELLAPFGGAE